VRGALLSAICSRWADRAFVVAGLACLTGLAWHHMAILGDGFWYVFSGRLILQRHAMPHDDFFTFASAGNRWIVFNAGAAVLWALLVQAFGLKGLLVVGALVASCAAGMLWLGNALAPSGRLLLFPLAVLFLVVDAEDLSARGQLFGDVGFIFLLAMIGRLRDGRAVHPLVPFVLGAAWANLHMSFVVAPLVPLVMAGLLLVDRAMDRTMLRPYLVFAALALAGCFANPLGARYAALTCLQAFDARTSQFDLFRSPDFHDPTWLVAPALGIAMLGARQSLGNDGGRRADQMFVAIFIAAACLSRRYATELVAVEAWILGRIVTAHAMSRGLAWARGVLGVACLVTGVLLLREPKDPLRDVPAEAAQLIVERNLPDRIMNPLHWGGYLGYAWNGARKYFIDGRDQTMLFGNGTLEDEGALWTMAPHWEHLLDVYEVSTVLWPRGAPLDVALRRHPAWSLVHEDRIAVVYVRAPRVPMAVPSPR
jgi:hypothetical protein